MTFDHSFAIRGRFTSPPAFPCQLSTINKPPVPRPPSPVSRPPSFHSPRAVNPQNQFCVWEFKPIEIGWGGCAIVRSPVPRPLSSVFSIPPRRDHHRINSVSGNSNRLKSVGVVVRVVGPPVSRPPSPVCFTPP